MSRAPIYPYIPFASSLVWNTSQESASPVSVHLSFTPDWFSARMGLSLEERWHRDPRLRRQSFVDMARALNAAFPRLMLGGDPDSIRGGLSQIGTCAVMAALFHRRITYSPAAWPENEVKTLTDAEADALEIPRFEEGAFYADLMKQMDLIQAEWGPVDGELNYQGVLNTAFRLRGEAIFMDMISAPERAHHVLAVVRLTMERFADAVYARQRASGVVKDYFVTSNCVVNMISEDHYRAFVMPQDKELSAHWPSFGIHNCGWTVDAYAPAYSEIGSLGYLDFGIASDLQRLRGLFPEAVLSVILNPDDVVGRGRGEIVAMLERLRDELGSCRIILGSLDGRTAADTVESFFPLTAEVWGVPAESVVPKPHWG